MVPYRKLNKANKEVIDITRDFWKWGSETGLGKRDWKYFPTLNSYKGGCGLCYINEDICKTCILFTPLFKRLVYSPLEHMCGYWKRWIKADAKSREKKVYAKIIWYLIERYRKGKEINQK